MSKTIRGQLPDKIDFYYIQANSIDFVCQVFIVTGTLEFSDIQINQHRKSPKH